MIIKFPQTGYKLDTLNPSEDFEERIEEVCFSRKGFQIRLTFKEA